MSVLFFILFFILILLSAALLIRKDNEITLEDAKRLNQTKHSYYFTYQNQHIYSTVRPCPCSIRHQRQVHSPMVHLQTLDCIVQAHQSRYPQLPLGYVLMFFDDDGWCKKEQRLQQLLRMHQWRQEERDSF